MEIYITVIKDILVIATPIIVAIISYRSSKKTERDIRLELEKSLKEKDADTSQILAKISAELESQKQILIATIKIVDTHLDGSFPSCLCPKNLKAIKASCVFGASAAEKAPRPAVCRQF